MLTITRCSRKLCFIRCSSKSFSSMQQDDDPNMKMIMKDDWEQEWMEQDRMRAAEAQSPWENLLRMPAQSNWRSSQPPPKHLTEAQKHVLQRGGRTNRQLWRTFDNIMNTHSALAEQREVERWRAVGGSRTKKAKINKTASSGLVDVQPVYYGPEQTLAGVKNRLLPNYAVARRVLAEAKGLLGPSFKPRRIVDVGIGCGAASAAALDVFGSNQVDWIHGIDPSKSQREVAEDILNTAVSSSSSNNNKEPSSLSSFNNITTSATTRITVSESLSTNSVEGANIVQGTFDLALCCYTLNELPHTASALALAAMLWEKLTNGGVLVIIEPGTPDGFNAIRSIREMLLECCPIIEEEASAAGYDQCHVIAPCTHNGRCPMDRHKNIASSSTLEKDQIIYSTPENAPVEGEEEENAELPVYESNWTNEDDADDEEWLDPDTFDPEGHPDWTEDSWDESSSRKKQHFVEEEAAYMPKYMSKLAAFDSAFCSFIQAVHGGDRSSEKFSYLVCQKIIGGSGLKEMADGLNLFGDVNLADLIASGFKNSNKDETLLNRAISIENRYLESNADELGLELVQGKNLSSWGRLIRPPLKKKGHVIIDFCSGKKMGQGDGQIIRHRVSRNIITKVAPGAYTAARKARWGGLWPDISSRLDDETTTPVIVESTSDNDSTVHPR